jgi:hypothetical protein
MIWDALHVGGSRFSWYPAQTQDKPCDKPEQEDTDDTNCHGYGCDMPIFRSREVKGRLSGRDRSIGRTCVVGERHGSLQWSSTEQAIKLQRQLEKVV